MKKTNKILIGMILISSLLLSIGYSAIQNITLDIKGTASAVPTTKTLVTGENFNKMLKGGEAGTSTVDTTITKIVFDYWSDGYSDGGIVIFDDSDWGSGTAIDLAAIGGIKLFKSADGTTVYILSEAPIYANANCTNMFRYFQAVTDIVFGNFSTIQVTSMQRMFDQCVKLSKLDLSKFKTSKVTTMNTMFAYLSLTELDLSGFDTSNVTNMNAMFQSCKVSKLDLSNFNTSKVKEMRYMFAYCSNLAEVNFSSFDTSGVTDMSCMFSYCHKLEQCDLSSFDTSKVTNMSNMFEGISKLKTIYVSDKWTTANVTSSSRLFQNCTSLVGGAGTKFNSSYTDKTYARIDGGPNSETPGYLTFKSSTE